MFGAAKPLAVADLGEFVRRKRMWRGRIITPTGVDLPLALPGGRSGPDPHAVELARDIKPRWMGWQPALAEAMDDHAHDQAGPGDRQLPAPIYVAIITLDGEPAIEVGYTVPWDDEHTLGARFRGDDLLELCGSVLEP